MSRARLRGASTIVLVFLVGGAVASSPWTAATALAPVVAPHVVQTFLPEVGGQPRPPASALVYVEVVADVFGYTEFAITRTDPQANALRHGVCAYLMAKGASPTCEYSNVLISEVESLPYNLLLGYSAQVSAYVGVATAEGTASLMAFRQFDSTQAVTSFIEQGLALCTNVVITPSTSPTLTLEYVINDRNVWVSVLPTPYTAPPTPTGAGFTGYKVTFNTHVTGLFGGSVNTLLSRLVDFVSQLLGVDPAYVTYTNELLLLPAAPLRRSLSSTPLGASASADVTFVVSLGSAAAASSASTKIPAVDAAWPDLVTFLSTRVNGVTNVTIFQHA
jgi:hypothetical protein